MIRLLALIAFIWSYHYAHTQTEAWEYALSDQEFQGSQFLDLIELDDMVIVGGAASSCHTPTLWVFDSLGHFIDTIYLKGEINGEPLYYYGKVTGLFNDSAEQNVYAIGKLAIADDVGARKAFIAKLDRNLNLENFYIHAHFPNNHYDQRISFLDSLFLIQQGNQLQVLNHSFEIVTQTILPVNIDYGIEYLMDTIYAYDKRDVSAQKIIIFDIHSDTIHQSSVYPFTHLEIVENTVVTLGTDLKLRRYDRTTLNQVDSLILTYGETATMRKTKNHQILIVEYRSGQPANISVLDQNLNQLYQKNSDLPDEMGISIYSNDCTYYQLGTYYYTKTRSSKINGIIPFIRKNNWNGSQKINRPSLEISNVSVLNSIIPDTCGIGSTGIQYCHFSGLDPVYYALTVKNTGDQIIDHFAYYTNLLFGFNCAYSIGFRVMENLALGPGKETIVQDSIHIYSLIDSLGFDFYVAGPNHMLHGDNNVFSSPDVTTSTVRFQKENFVVYPNPTSDILHIRSPISISNDFSISVFDVQGRKIVQKRIFEPDLNVSALLPGIYFIQISDGYQIFQCRFMKQ